MIVITCHLIVIMIVIMIMIINYYHHDDHDARDHYYDYVHFEFTRT